jgi:hypothetical protein
LANFSLSDLGVVFKAGFQIDQFLTKSDRNAISFLIDMPLNSEQELKAKCFPFLELKSELGIEKVVLHNYHGKQTVGYINFESQQKAEICCQKWKNENQEAHPQWFFELRNYSVNS